MISWVVVWALSFLFLVIFISMYFRKVVPTNEVHIVQRTKKTTPYWKDLPDGAVYYNRPSRVPVIGIARIILPTSMFTIELNGYYAYDKEKVPFVIDVMAWFRVEDSKTAAQRIENFGVLKAQLDDILKGAVRAVLASDNVISIMEMRKELGEKFKNEVLEQCQEYWVYTVNIDFMDIRDPNDDSSSVIADIMEKKKSMIEKESRIEVANNKKEARIAEIDAQKEADVINEAALQAVGEREALKQQKIGVAMQKSEQEIQLEAKTTEEQKMNVLEVQKVREAQILKQQEIIRSEETQQKMIIEAEWQRKQTEEIALGQMNAEKQRAEGIQAVGLAEAEARKAMELAPVKAQIELAKEIGENEGYMNYLLWVDWIKAWEHIGVAKAKALEEWDLKIIANQWTVDSWMTSLMDLFNGKWGTQLWTMLEALKQLPAWKEVYERIIHGLSKEHSDTKEVEVLDSTTIESDQSENQ